MALNFTDKGAALITAIHAAGHWIARDEDGVLGSSDDTAVQAIIDSYQLAGAITEVKARIDRHAAALREKTTAGTSAPEMSSWSLKKAEAEKHANSRLDTDAPMLGAESAKRGVPLATVRDRVLSSASMLAALEAQIAGNAGKHKDTVSLLTDLNAVLTYDWSTGWPI